MLVAFLEDRIDRLTVAVMSYETLVTSGRTDFRQYDVLIVDEAQDLMGFEHLDVLGQVVEGGLEQGRWRFFLDSNNQTNLYPDFDADALEFLHSYSPVLLRLTRNCRNTEEVVLQTKLVTRADLGVASGGLR
jgi:hypothetical protein